MANDGSRKHGPQGTGEESPSDVFGAELWTEVRGVCDRAHALLGDQVVGGTGAAETERVCLDIPAGLLMIAQYVAARAYFKQDWAWMEAALDDKGSEGRAARKVVHDALAKRLTDALHEELHWLATGGHRILLAEAERRGRTLTQGEQPRSVRSEVEYDKDGRIIPPESLEEDAGVDLFGKDMWAEVCELCDDAYRLLRGEIAGGYGAPDTKEVCLNIPSGLLLIARYITGREAFGRSWNEMQAALDNKGEAGKDARHAVHARLTKYLTDALHEELRQFPTGEHHVLQEELTRRGWGTIKPGKNPPHSDKDYQ